jgi:hypothetical protein
MTTVVHPFANQKRILRLVLQMAVGQNGVLALQSAVVELKLEPAQIQLLVLMVHNVKESLLRPVARNHVVVEVVAAAL